ncbi:hypothetical protein [Helicobacter brantae]|uniref:Autotransporter domain-containing protein n=1 Tax=Helicobacter brantae TaxID=375927 RepID=A0A3D8J4H4_9HELI|nr:hypothetical protein [Helicobacter brantae]RDU72045.1 hypothetical protein CQA58_00090 [Helicobacter brantae]
MRKIKSENNYNGGGGRVKNQRSIFKPLISSSLALALGVSVGNATTSFYQQDSNGGQGTAISPTNLTWGTTTIGEIQYSTFLYNSTLKDTFKLYVKSNQNTWNSSGSQLDIQSNAMLVSNTGLAMGDSGTGTLTWDMWTNTGDNTPSSFIMDLSTITDSNSYAFYGNITIAGSTNGSQQNYSNKTLTGKFGGKGIKGSLTFNSLGNADLIFGNNAGIEGSVTISQGTNTLTFNGVGATISNGLTANGGINTINLNANTTLTLNNGNGNISTTAGTTSINFKGENGILAGGVETSGGSTTINIADSSSGTINGNISTPSPSTTLATIVFASGNGNKSLRLGGSSNTLAGITLGNGNASTNNTLSLSGGTTVIGVSTTPTTIASGNGLNIVFENANTMLRNNIANSGTANINFNGSNGHFSGNIATTGSGAVTTINISDGNSGTIDEAVTTANSGATNIDFASGSNAKSLTLSAGGNTLSGITLGSNSTANTLALSTGSTIFNGASGVSVGENQALTFDLTGGTTLTFTNGLLSNGGTSLFNVKDSASSTINGNITLSDNGENNVNFAGTGTLILQGADNQLTSVSSTTSGILSLDGASNSAGVSASVSNAITGNTTTLNFNGTTDKKAEMTLSASGNELKAITLEASATNNKLILSAGSTSVETNTAITTGQALTFDFANGSNVNLTNNISNAGTTNLEFNGTNGTLTGTLDTTAGTTTIKIANGKSGSISGAVTTAESGATTTINFAEGDGDKTLQLGQDTNTLTNITFGNGSSSSTHNTLDLNGSTTIKDTTTISANQGLTFNYEGKNVELTNNISNTGGEANVRFGEDNGTLTGNVSTSGGTTALNFIQSGSITQGVSTSGGTTIISIGSAKTATITSGVTTSDSGSTQIDFIGESTLAGAASTTGGTTTFNLGSSNSSTATATISGTITNSATNIFNVNATTTTLKNDNGLVFSGGTNTINFANTNGSTLTWQDSNGETQNISTTGGTTNINFDNDGVISGGVSTNGTTATTTTITIADGKSGTINGAVSTGASNSTTNISFANGSGAKSLTLSAGDNTLTGITLGNNSTANTLTLSTGTTTINTATNIANNQALTFDLKDSVNLTNNISNAGTTNLEFNGSNGLLTGTISTTAGITTISIANGKSGSISGAVTTTTGSGTTNIDFASGSNAKSLTLSAGDNTLSRITLGSNSTANTLTLSQGSTGITDTTTIAENQALTFDFADGNNVNLTNNLENTGGSAKLEFNGTNGTLTGTLSTSGGTTAIKIADSKSGTITGAIATTSGTTNIDFADGSNAKSLNLQGANNAITTITSNGSNNTLNLDTTRNGVSVGVTNAIVGDSLTISMGGTTSKNAELTLNNTNGDSTLKALTLANASAVEENVLNLGARKTTITDNLSIASNQGMTINLSDNTELASGITNQGTTNLAFNGSAGLLTGTISTTAGTTTIKIAEGKSGTISGAVTTAESGATNIDFADGSGAKSLTLGAGGNTLTGIVLGSDSTANTLFLSQGSTTFNGTSGVNVGANQALTFDLANGTTLAFTNGLLSNGGTSLFNVKDSASSIINGNITLSNDGANNVTIGNGGTLALQGENNQLTSVSSTTSGTLSLDGASNENGVSASVLSAIVGNSTTLNFNGRTDKKAEMTLSDGGNALKAITLGSGATNNTLILSQGNTSIDENVSITSGQVMIFNLEDNSSLAFANNITNTGSLKSLAFNFQGGSTKINAISGDITTGDSLSSDVITTLNVTNASTGVIIGNIYTTNSNTTNVAIGENGTLTLQGADNQLTSVSSTTSGTLKLDGASSSVGVTASVSSAITADESGNKTTTLNFNGASGKKAEMTLSASGNALKAITLGDSATNNKLILSTGSTSIETGTTITTSQALTFVLADGSDVNLTNAISNTGGSANLEFNGTNGILTGTLDTSNNGTTTIKIAEGKSGTITGSITNSATTTADIGNNATLTLTAGLSNSRNTTFNFNGENGTLTGNTITTSAGATTIFNLGSSASISEASSSVTATINGTLSNNGTNTFNVNSATTTLQYGASGLSFSSGTNEINFANTSENGATLSWQNSDGDSQAITTSGGSTNINFNHSGSIAGGVNTTDSGTTNINIADEAIATINGNITTPTPSRDGFSVRGATPATNVTFKSTEGKTSTLILQGSTNQITTLTMGAGENILALMQNGEKGKKQKYTSRDAVIENVNNMANGTLKLISQISTNEANTFTINSATFSTSKEVEGNQDDTQANTPKLTGHISLILSDGVDTNQVGKESPILVASVKNDSGIEFEKTSKLIDGFLIKEADFTIADDGNYQKYLLSSVRTQGITTSEQQAIASAFMLDYNLYMANLNSLNRRMGELRENAHSQGVWARVFNGALSNDFGLGSKSNYTTIQAGYDYAFGFEGANNYLGVALSYALSFATSNSKATDYSMGEVRGLDNIYSNAVEVALYNSYVADSGWYNDTIAKFSYIMSSFDIQASGVSAESRASETNNYALTLSDEVGYAIRMGEMSEWSLTPQVEATFGYFSQSDFKQTLSDSSQYLDSKAESVLTLRARAGSALTYDFRAFTQKDTFNASLYVGAFYEYDYVMGGDISMVVSDGTTETQKSDIGTDGRVVVNVGTNMTIQDNTRLYFDFEKSFMGKINTDYQVNFGVRYSFGESDGYSPILEKADYKAPLKIEGEEKEGEESGEKIEGKEGEGEAKSDKAEESKTTKDTKAPAKSQPKEKSSK